MSNVALIACTWLHLIATVVWIGHIVNSFILFTPLSKRYVPESSYGDFLANYRRRDQPIALSTIATFFVTGLGLMLLDPEYQGLGSIFANSWSIMVFAKHVIVLVMVGLGIYMGTAIMPRLAKAWSELASEEITHSTTNPRVTGLERLRNIVAYSLLVLSLVVLLLTAIGETI